MTHALQPLPTVFAGWEGGSAAFEAVDDYSDIDLTYLVEDAVPFEALYDAAARALGRVSPITASYTPPVRGRYYRLRDGGDYLLVDLCFIRVGDSDHFLDVERHGQVIPLFDKGNWLQPKAMNDAALSAKREQRRRELETWFPISQTFVRKAIRRGQDIEAVNAYWSCTLKPLAELLRMRHCPVRWDFGVRYLDRDLPPAEYERFRELTFVGDIPELERKHAAGEQWGQDLLRILAVGLEGRANRHEQ